MLSTSSSRLPAGAFDVFSQRVRQLHPCNAQIDPRRNSIQLRLVKKGFLPTPSLVPSISIALVS